MIVKVQISLESSDDLCRVLVYNQDRSVTFEGPATPKIIELMAQEPKKFFRAAIKGHDISLQAEVEDPGW